MPAAVRAIWPSVYAFVCEGNGSVYTASAFLVGRADRGKTSTYYFMTAGHAIEDCRSPRRYLTEDVNRPRFESDGITLAAPLPRLGGISTVYVDDAYDLAVVKVEASAELRIGNPLRAGDQCDKAVRREVYARRISGRRQAPIPAPQSRGQALEQGELRWLRQGRVPRYPVASISLRASIHFPAARAVPWWMRAAS